MTEEVPPQNPSSFTANVGEGGTMNIKGSVAGTGIYETTNYLADMSRLIENLVELHTAYSKGDGTEEAVERPLLKLIDTLRADLGRVHNQLRHAYEAVRVANDTNDRVTSELKRTRRKLIESEANHARCAMYQRKFAMALGASVAVSIVSLTIAVASFLLGTKGSSE